MISGDFVGTAFAIIGKIKIMFLKLLIFPFRLFYKLPLSMKIIILASLIFLSMIITIYILRNRGEHWEVRY